MVSAAHAAGLQVWGWWYYYGSSNNEGTISGDHAVALGLDGVILDIEAPWEESSSNAAGRRAKARSRRTTTAKAMSTMTR